MARNAELRPVADRTTTRALHASIIACLGVGPIGAVLALVRTCEVPDLAGQAV